MTGWSQHLDVLAGATAALLQAGPVRTEPLVDLPVTLACRDAVVGRLRELVRSVSEAPRFAPVNELNVFDVVQRPGQALHQAGLPKITGTRRCSFSSLTCGKARKCRVGSCYYSRPD